MVRRSAHRCVNRPKTGSRHTVRELFGGCGVNPTMTPILEARGLVKRYGAVQAVNGVSFSIAPGELLGILGPNGSGKSTIVKMVTGLSDPSRGQVFFRGQAISADLALFKRSLGYVPEQPDLYGFMSGWEYLDLVATLRSIPAAAARAKAAALLEGFALYPHRDSLIASYSKGMRQRIVLIAAMLHDPELLVLDEPFSGLDVASAMVLRNVIALLSAKGKAILFSSPVLEQVERLCTHLLLLKKGNVVVSGPFDELQSAFAGMGLEGGFMQLTEQVDAARIADNIVAAVEE